jgi:hypothetical protein
MKQGTATYNEKTDRQVAINNGLFNAHVIKMTSKEIRTGMFVFNFTFRLHESNEEQIVDLFEPDKNGTVLPILIIGKDGKSVQETAKATHMVGREIRSNGIWYHSSPAVGDGWKNAKYRNVIKNVFELDLPTKEVGGVLVEVLGELEEEDVLLKPCLVNIKTSSYLTRPKDGSAPEKKFKTEVADMLHWNGGMLDAGQLNNGGHKTEAPAF